MVSVLFWPIMGLNERTHIKNGISVFYWNFQEHDVDVVN